MQINPSGEMVCKEGKNDRWEDGKQVWHINITLPNPCLLDELICLHPLTENSYSHLITF